MVSSRTVSQGLSHLNTIRFIAGNFVYWFR